MSNIITGNRTLLLKILPGLGKSYLGKNHVNFVDYEDWLEANGHNYKERKGAQVSEDLEAIIDEVNTLAPLDDVYISSSIAWEDFEVEGLHSVLYVHMAQDEYNCEEVKLRNRPELCDKFGDRLVEWNNTYGPAKARFNWESVNYSLHSEEMLNKNRIVEILAHIKGYG